METDPLESPAPIENEDSNGSMDFSGDEGNLLGKQTEYSNSEDETGKYYKIFKHTYDI